MSIMQYGRAHIVINDDALNAEIQAAIIRRLKRARDDQNIETWASIAVRATTDYANDVKDLEKIGRATLLKCRIAKYLKMHGWHETPYNKNHVSQVSMVAAITAEAHISNHNPPVKTPAATAVETEKSSPAMGKINYTHQHTDPLSATDNVIQISGHTQNGRALVSQSKPDPVDNGVFYIDAHDVPSAIVALIASSDFITQEPGDENFKKLQETAQKFIDIFREDLASTFKEDLQAALDESTSDWEAKCRVSEITDRYDNLR